MIRIFVLLVVCVAVVMHVSGLSAGWAWIIILALAAGFAVWALSHGQNRYVTPSAIWRCPFCQKRTKLFAAACHHCGRMVVVPKQQP